MIQLLQIVCLVSLGVKPVGCFNGAKEGFYLISAGTIATCATVAVVCDEGPVDLRTTDKARQPSQRDIDRARSRIPGLSQWESSVRRNLARKRYLESIFRASSTGTVAGIGLAGLCERGQVSVPAEDEKNRAVSPIGNCC